jgi:hypothetical protein
MAGQKLFIGGRKSNGEIGFISDGFDAKNFIELLGGGNEKPGKIVLVDYAPVIEKLHELHKATSDENTRNKYNSMFNYWQDAKTHEIGQVRIHKAEVLAGQANSLINELQLKLEKMQNDGTLSYNIQVRDLNKTINSFRALSSDSEIYIDALLIYIHSKASLEIGSFKKDVVLTKYARYLSDLLFKIYKQLTGFCRDKDSFLKFLAFEKPEILEEHLLLSGKGKSSDEFLLELMRGLKSYQRHNDDRGYHQEVSIQFDNWWPELSSTIEDLKDLLYKAQSINDFLDTLRKGGVEWDESPESVDELIDKLKLPC